MIIFDLDDCLADCDHRKHLIDPHRYREICEYSNYRMVNGDPLLDLGGKASWRYKSTGEPFDIGFKPFYKSCDKDKPILETIYQFRSIKEILGLKDLQIWSGRCESVREETEDWLKLHVSCWGEYLPKVKMRQIGNETPLELLKSKWMNEALEKGSTIDYVFDAHKKSISMWRSRGVFVFNCIRPNW